MPIKGAVQCSNRRGIRSELRDRGPKRNLSSLHRSTTLAHDSLLSSLPLSPPSYDPFNQSLRSEKFSEEFILLLFVNLNMAIAMGRNFMTFGIDHLYHLRCSLCNVSENEEGGFDFEAAEKGEDLLDIDEDSTFTSIPGRTRENVLNITDVIPILNINRQNIFHVQSISRQPPPCLLTNRCNFL